MKKQAFKLILYMAITISHTALADNRFKNGNDAYKMCEGEENEPQFLQCQGYVIGAVDAFLSTQAVMEAHWFCLPEQVTAGEVIDVFRKYMKDNPAERHFTGGSLIFKSIVDAFPCK